MLRADSTDIGFKNSHRWCRWWYWYMKWSVTRVWRLKAAHDQISSGNWVGKKSTSDNHTSHLQQNTHGSINNNYISSMSQMIYILNLSSALNQAKRPNHSQSDWICVRAFFFKGRYLHPRSRNFRKDYAWSGRLLMHVILLLDMKLNDAEGIIA